jgi:hypothetical protein
MKTFVGFAVAAVLGVGVANAAITPSSPGPGELIEWVVDNTNGHVYARGLQVLDNTILPSSSILSASAYASATPPVSTGYKLAAPIAADGNLTTFLGQDNGGDTFSFALLGAGQGTGFNPGGGIAEFTSANTVAASNLTLPTGSTIHTLVTNVNGTTTTLNGIIKGTAGDGTSADVSAQFTNANTAFNLYSANIQTTSALGTDMNLYAITPNGSSAAKGQLYTAGMFTVLSNGTLEQLPTVPLPAAVWLLGSGLLGLAGVGRRRISA